MWLYINKTEIGPPGYETESSNVNKHHDEQESYGFYYSPLSPYQQKEQMHFNVNTVYSNYLNSTRACISILKSICVTKWVIKHFRKML